MRALNTLMGGAMVSLMLATSFTAPAWAQPTPNAANIDFGDDSSPWAKDGECDDPRFTGPGAAQELVEADRMKDATDCRAAFEAGKVTFKDDAGTPPPPPQGQPGTPPPLPGTTPPPLPGADAPTAPSAPASPAPNIDFGDDSSPWAKDGECDDPRFTGPGSAQELVEADRMKDATDCRAAFEAGTVTLKDTGAIPPATITPPADIDFGDDSSEWAKDGECDDPRFTGPGSAQELVEADRMKDATDCRAAFEAGTVTLKDAAATPAATTPTAADIDFGDDSSEWAKDGECDDPRFTGAGSAQELVEADRMKDATDCRAAFEAGTVTLKETGASQPAATLTPIGEIDFGDDSSNWAKDGECDDPRFTGPGSATTLLDEDRLKDATDCRAAYEAGTVTLKTDAAATPAVSVPVSEINFGNDTSDWANDGECDDPRFTGPGVATTAIDLDIAKDATDCRAAVEAGTATYTGERVASSDAFDYGSDSSKWANDGECDDPRFTGIGTNKKLLGEDMYADATDCKAAVEAGTASVIAVYTPEYAAAAPYDSTGIDFGDNSSNYSNDDECDDPRFIGPGTATTLLDSDRMADANDCKAAYEAGTIMLREDLERGM
ncbi:hypothetical protein ACFQ30_18595 [Devosia equisanguinis]